MSVSDRDIGQKAAGEMAAQGRLDMVSDNSDNTIETGCQPVYTMLQSVKTRFEVTMRCSEAETLTEIILAIFRVNGRLLKAGDDLVESLNLTGARWQVMGALVLAGKSLTAPQIAAAMGITRQGVQKQINALAREGLVTLNPNSGNKRSPFISLSERGAHVYEKVDRLQAGWANGLVEGIPSNDLEVTLRTLETVRNRLIENSGGRGI